MPSQPFATAVVRRLVEAGHIAYFAGGWVRDFLLKHPSDDIDIATSASVEEIQALFPKTIPVGVSFGIVIVVHEGHHFEVATFRKDKGYVDGRRPTGIDPASPKEDAQRRDFTINGMFYNPLQKELLDYVGGQADLKQGIIRAIGNPHERFLEDRLRLMRAVRYATRFNFPIEDKTLQAIRDHAPTLLPAVAMERIWQEFKKMSQFAHFDRGLVLLHELGLLPTIFPQLQGLSTEEIRKRAVFIEKFPKNTPTIAELLELFSPFSLEQAIELCAYLKLSNPEKEFVRFYHRSNQLLNMPADWLQNLELWEWAHYYAHPDAQLALDLFAAHLHNPEAFLHQHAERRNQLAWAIERIQKKTPLIRAEDLQNAGIQPGVLMGKLLTEAERLAINHSLQDPTQILSRLRQSPLWP